MHKPKHHEVLAKELGIRIESCPKGLVHMHVGAASFSLPEEALERIARASRTAADALRQKNQGGVFSWLGLSGGPLSN